MTITVYEELEQGSDAWLQARAGIITASTVGKLLSGKTYAPADNDTSRTLIRSLVTERITGRPEETSQSYDMLRGSLSEPHAREEYEKHHTPVDEVGFITRDFGDFTLGYSPDGMVSEEGLIEIKSPKPHHHLRTLTEDRVPGIYLPQLHQGLMVSDREWIDYISYSPGLPLYVTRVERSLVWDRAILQAAERAEQQARELMAAYNAAASKHPATEWRDVFEEEEILL
ncbi:lambda exonuclease family protein [Nesterenkonia lacusekhoensis]|uniref:YqaJ viral recombinase domain-containing protein n=1 Tax=Nesterenkonia lacusekhoensis TaxID=150832 RepID=A0ABS4SYS7_9MICC|nr:lambda exonuclease family protein [Nesterenkonia lacusekhoensis]MBP2317362.1 hypothetical protein [Nesterenkonia lacusekhoensis]